MDVRINTQALRNFRTHYFNLRRAAPLAFLQPVYITSGGGTLFFLPRKVDSSNRDIYAWRRVKINGGTELLPEFNNLEVLANFANLGFVPAARDLILQGIMPLYDASQPIRPEEITALNTELWNTAAALQKKLVYLSEEKLYVLTDEFSGLPLGSRIIKLENGEAPVAFFRNALQLTNYLEGRDQRAHEAAQAERLQEATVKTLVLKLPGPSPEVRRKIEAEGMPLGAIYTDLPGTQKSFSLSPTAYAITHIGGRKNNEDAAVVEGNLLLVADGMGGHQSGEVASRLAVRLIPAALKHGLSPQEALSYAEERIIEEAKKDPHKGGMGTTVAGVLVTGNTAEVFYAGDSRVYQVKKDGRVILLTRDHSGPISLLDQGDDNVFFADHPDLKEEYQRAKEYQKAKESQEAEAAKWKWPLEGQALDNFEKWMAEYKYRPASGDDPTILFTKNTVTNNLGKTFSKREKIFGIIKDVPVEPGDRFVICSDGLTDVLQVAQALRVLRNASTPEALAEGLLSGALAAQKSKKNGDNVTIAVDQHPEAEEPEPPTVVMAAVLIKLDTPEHVEETLTRIVSLQEDIPPAALPQVKAKLAQLKRDYQSTDENLYNLACAAEALL